MRIQSIKKSALSAAAALTLGSTAMLAHLKVEVTIENLSPEGGLFFTPVWFGFHDGGFDLFDVGSPATTGLQTLAETGNPAVLDGEFGMAGDRVSMVQNNPGGLGPGLHNPGAKASFEIELDPTSNRYFSFATMLLPSNDAFLGVDDPMGLGLFDDMGNFLGANSWIFGASSAWDAGTEENGNTGSPLVSMSNGNAATGGDPTDPRGNVSQHPGLEDFLGSKLGPNMVDFDSTFTAGSDDFQIARISVREIQAVPEPSAYAFGAASTLMLGFVIWKRRRSIALANRDAA